MSKRIAIALLIFTLILTACAASSRNLAPSEMPAVAPSVPQLESLAGSRSAEKAAYTADQAAASVDRLVIKNASLSIAVNDPLKSMDNISHLAESMGGYVVSADVYQQSLSGGAKVHQVSMSIRVPVERLDEALTSIKAETDQPIISENVSSQDVTAEYTDLNSRLTNAQATEKQLQVIMDQATKTEDVLSVYSKLSEVREQIELIKGQMKYYEQSAKLSLISIQLIPNASIQPITIAGWQPKGIAKQAVQSLINAMQSLAGFGIRLVIYYLPVMIAIFGPIALVVWGIVSLVRRSRKPKKASTPAPEA